MSPEFFSLSPSLISVSVFILFSSKSLPFPLLGKIWLSVTQESYLAILVNPGERVSFKNHFDKRNKKLSYLLLAWVTDPLQNLLLWSAWWISLTSQSVL